MYSGDSWAYAGPGNNSPAPGFYYGAPREPHAYADAETGGDGSSDFEPFSNERPAVRIAVESGLVSRSRSNGGGVDDLASRAPGSLEEGGNSVIGSDGTDALEPFRRRQQIIYEKNRADLLRGARPSLFEFSPGEKVSLFSRIKHVVIRLVFRVNLRKLLVRALCIFTFVQAAILIILAQEEPVLADLQKNYSYLFTTTGSSEHVHKSQLLRKDFHLGVFTTMWKRPLLTDFVLAHWHQLKLDLEPEGLILELFVTGSEGNVSEALASKHGWGYHDHPNQPLGAKHNAGMRAMRQMYPLMDAVMIIGSDDIVNKEYLQQCRKYLREPQAEPYGCKGEGCEVDMVAMMDIYFMDMATMVLGYTAGYDKNVTTRRDYTLGFGRCVRASVMEQVGWAPWADELQRYLDGSMYKSLDTVLLPKGGLPMRTVNLTCKVHASAACSWFGRLTTIFPLHTLGHGNYGDRYQVG
mmetsp:Transcript_800/g.2949  ORF Transcript_800/g.2949 Transcript_800/m.2949 type:complete len:466 (+) Transcript_800:69-1466(+)